MRMKKRGKEKRGPTVPITSRKHIKEVRTARYEEHASVFSPPRAGDKTFLST